MKILDELNEYPVVLRVLVVLGALLVLPIALAWMLCDIAVYMLVRGYKRDR